MSVEYVGLSIQLHNLGKRRPGKTAQEVQREVALLINDKFKREYDSDNEIELEESAG